MLRDSNLSRLNYILYLHVNQTKDFKWTSWSQFGASWTDILTASYLIIMILFTRTLNVWEKTFVFNGWIFWKYQTWSLLKFLLSGKSGELKQRVTLKISFNIFFHRRESEGRKTTTTIPGPYFLIRVISKSSSFQKCPKVSNP